MTGGPSAPVIVGGADITEHFKKVLAEAPPLTDEQTTRLRNVLTAPAPQRSTA